MRTVSANFAARLRCGILPCFALAFGFLIGPSGGAQITGALTAAPAPSSEKVAGELQRFEVAVIKPTDPTATHSSPVSVYPGGRLVLQAVGLRGLIHMAFDVDFGQILGAEQFDKGGYDIEAKAPETSPPTTYNLRHSLFEIEDERLRQMLQALLIDRFQLKFHRVTKTGPVYLLVKSGKPIPLHPVDVNAKEHPYGEGFGQVGWAGDWNLYNVTMPQLAKFAGAYVLHRPVIDRTGVEGSFDYRSKMSEMETGAQDNGDADSFRFFMEEIGLKLVPSTGPVESFVIDSAEKPSPN